MFLKNGAEVPHLSIFRDAVHLVSLLEKESRYDGILVLSILESTYAILRRQFSAPLTGAVLRQNFAPLCLVLDEVLSGGFPFCLELNSLQSTVVGPSVSGLVDTLTSVVSGLQTGESSKNSLTGVTPEIWWRRMGVVHSSNELYLDVVDRLNLIVSSSGRVISSSVSGRIDVNSKLSGVPEVLVSLKEPKMFLPGSISFHPCVRIPRWKRDSKLSFVPPDGSFTLAEYCVFDKEGLALPFTLNLKTEYETELGNLHVQVTPNLNFLLPKKELNKPAPKARESTLTIDDVHLTIKLPPAISGATLVSNTGSARFDPFSKSVYWSLGKVSVESAAGVKLEGSLVHSETNVTDLRDYRSSASVEFLVRGWAASSIKVDSVELSAIEYTPHKGCRYSTTAGRIDIRM